MLLVESTPGVGEVFGFEYTTVGGFGGRTTKKRLVVVQRVDSDGFFGHDFLADGPRNFKFNKIKVAKNLTEKARIYDYGYIEDLIGDVEEFAQKFEAKGAKVYNDEENELVYVVNV
jgi:hypothetical protein